MEEVGQGGHLVPSCAEKLLSLEGAWSRGLSLGARLGLPISVSGPWLSPGDQHPGGGEEVSLVPATLQGLQP